MPRICHLATHRVVSIYSNFEHIDCVRDIAGGELTSRGYMPTVASDIYVFWNRKGFKGWLYRLMYLKPEFLKDTGLLSPEAKK